MAQRQINKGFVHFFKLCTGKTAMHKDQQNKNVVVRESLTLASALVFIPAVSGGTQ